MVFSVPLSIVTDIFQYPLSQKVWTLWGKSETIKAGPCSGGAYYPVGKMSIQNIPGAT